LLSCVCCLRCGIALIVAGLLVPQGGMLRWHPGVQRSYG
jgi:hypothetical protein